MKPGTSCENCGVTEAQLQSEKPGKRRRIEGHHEDYSMPDCLTYLCKSCHRKLHGYKNRLQRYGAGDELVTLSTSLPTEFANKVRKAAKADDRSVSFLIRRAILKALEKK